MTHSPQTSESRRTRQEAHIRRFEEALKDGQSPVISDYLPSDDEDRLAVLIELVFTELEYRLRNDASARVEEYLKRFPELAEHSSVVLDLIAHECDLRQQRGEGARITEYLDRFPEHGTELGTRLMALIPHPDQTLRTDSAAAAPACPSPRSGDSALPEVPGYEVLQEIGRGGMGVVYQARHLGLDRLVALKMLALGMADQRMLQRFQSEAQAVARLQHPHIVQIYDVGRHAGSPFLALEYVEGGSLDRRLAGNPQPQDQAAQLVLTLARAIDAAHERGIIHRDLKPANVLLATAIPAAASEQGESAHVADGYGFPKITDFGLAKHLHDESGQTKTGDIMGTPSYMAPEQARARGMIGPAADVYALGAILYEMLTGRPPFRGQSAWETVEQVLLMEPVAPGLLQIKVARDLETICLKCLQKEPGRRYPTAAALADDLERFLQRKPILARPVTSTERFWRWCQRNPVVATLAAGLVLVMLGGLVGMTVLYWQAAEERDAKVEALQALEGEQKRTLGALAAQVAARKKTQQALARVSNRVVARALGRQVKLNDADRLFLQEIIKDYEELAATTGDAREALELRGECLAQIGKLRSELGASQEAEESYREARNLYTTLVASFPDEAGYRNDLAEVLDGLGSLYLKLRRNQEAETALRTAVDYFQGLHAAYPESTEYQSNLARSQANLGLVFKETSRFQEAEAALRSAIKIESDLVARHSSDPSFAQNLANSHNGLGALLRLQGQFKGADAEFQIAEEMYRQLAASNPDEPYYRWRRAMTLGNRANLLSRDLHRLDDAQSTYRASVKLLRELVDEYPSIQEYRHDLANCYNGLAVALGSHGQAEAMADALREVVKIQTRLVADFPAMPEHRHVLAVSHSNLGGCLLSMGRHREAEPELRAALKILDELVAAHPKDRNYRAIQAAALNNLGLLLGTLENHEAARAMHERSLAVRRQLSLDFPAVPAYRDDQATSLFNLGQSLMALRRPGEAEAAYQAASALLEKLSSEYPEKADYHDSLGAVLVLLASLQNDRGAYPEALKLLDAARPHHELALKKSRQRDFEDHWRDNRRARCVALAGLAGQVSHGDLAAAGQELAGLAGKRAEDLYLAATCLALASAHVQMDSELAAEKRKAQSETYAVQAIALLQQSVRAGLKEKQRLATDPRLDPVRERADFKNLSSSGK